MKMYCDRNKCYFCGLVGVKSNTSRNLIERHHLVERHEGGSNEPTNLVACCSTCHSRIHLNIIKIDKWYDVGYGMKLKWTYKGKDYLGSATHVL
jgi:hypothetical protein